MLPGYSTFINIEIDQWGLDQTDLYIVKLLINMSLTGFSSHSFLLLSIAY